MAGGKVREESNVPYWGSKPRRRIALVGGGTAGHVYPALAVAEAYQQAYDHVDLLFIGTADGYEARLVPAFGYRFHTVTASKLFGVDVWGRAQALGNLALGMAQARHLLRTHGSQLVLGFGGYVSAGVLLAAWSLGLRTAIHEANVVPGLSNRLLGRVVDRVYLGFEAASWPFSADRTLVTGIPVRAEIAQLRPPQGSVAATDQSVHLLVTGGSQGSPFLNQHAPCLLQQVADHGLSLQVWHQVGQCNPEPVRRAYADAAIPSTVTPYIDKMASAYAWADFAIACSGSGTIAELAVCGLPALLVPLSDVAGDHQSVNAAAFAQGGAAWWVREADWNPTTLAPQLVARLRDSNFQSMAAHHPLRLITQEAAQRLVAHCEALMAGQW